MHYVKIPNSLLHSDLWGNDHVAKIVWITMVLMADRDGFVDASVDGVARAAVIERAAAERALERLSAPDKRLDGGLLGGLGRYVARVGLGWRVLGFESFVDEPSRSSAPAGRARKNGAR